MRWIILGIAATLAVVLGLFLAAGGRLIALEYRDFPQDELEKLIIAEPSEAELTLGGPLEVQVSSPWTRWAMKLLPGTFLVDVKINGQNASLVVDSGASWTVLSPQQAVAAQVALTGLGPTVQHGERMDVPTYLGRVQKLELDGLVAHELPVVVIARQLVLKVLGLPVYRLDGLLGIDLLSQFALTLEYDTGTVVFRRESFLPTTPALTAHLQILREPGPKGLESRFLIAECFIKNSGPFQCFIDTGTSAPVSVPQEIWGVLELQRKGHLPMLRLGEIELKDVPAQPSNTRFILIGSNIFQAQGFRRLTLDFIAGKLYAER